MGSFLGGGSAKKAAKIQAKAIAEQTKLNVAQANYAAESATQQMAQAQAQRAASDYAERLLSVPQEQAQVNLAPQETLTDDGLLQRRRTIRDTYRGRAPNVRSRAVSAATGINLS